MEKEKWSQKDKDQWELPDTLRLKGKELVVLKAEQMKQVA